MYKVFICTNVIYPLKLQNEPLDPNHRSRLRVPLRAIMQCNYCCPSFLVSSFLLSPSYAQGLSASGRIRVEIRLLGQRGHPGSMPRRIAFVVPAGVVDCDPTKFR